METPRLHQVPPRWPRRPVPALALAGLIGGPLAVPGPVAAQPGTLPSAVPRPSDRVQGTSGGMVVPEDMPRAGLPRNRLLLDGLPAWVRRCGGDDAEAWNHFIAPTRGILARSE